MAMAPLTCLCLLSQSLGSTGESVTAVPAWWERISRAVPDMCSRWVEQHGLPDTGLAAEGVQADVCDTWDSGEEDPVPGESAANVTTIPACPTFRPTRGS